MNPELIERFRPVLESLEKARLKIIYDRKAYLFIALLVAFLGGLLFVSGVIGSSNGALLFGAIFWMGTLAILIVRARLGGAYIERFRREMTREWFHARYRGVFLAPAPARSDLPIEVTRSLREACIRATAQKPALTSIEERVFFESDTYQSWSFILRERHWWGGVKSRALVWFRAVETETPKKVAFVLPNLTGQPKVHIFENGREVIGGGDPVLSSKLLAVYEKLRAKARGRLVRVSVSPTGVWAGVRLGKTFFEPPLLSSALDPASYDSWERDAELPVDRDIAPLLTTIA